MLSIYRIGHLNHSWPYFENLLKTHAITTLADLRTYPRSRFAQFNQQRLQAALAASGIGYEHFGAELGGRGQDGAPLDHEAIYKTPRFGAALEKMLEIASHQRLVLMCSERVGALCENSAIPV
ncbi:MAG: DUF488 family protein [Alphaproteobacteria bacterium]|nr:DUF488 family protein [Alphaproteobacteria bacterium]